MKTEPQCNLFVYGLLRDKALFLSVCGYDFDLTLPEIEDNTLWAEPGFVLGYTTVSPDRQYRYAVPASRGRTDGLLIHKVPLTALPLIDRYEGCYYRREDVKVYTNRAGGRAQMYVANEPLLERDFGNVSDAP